MDEVMRAYYEVAFERDYLKKKGNAFQDFFADIMEKRYPGDFQRVRPWGKFGDRKNDGYLKTHRKLFQVYAPNEMQSSQAIKKIDEDFNEALPYWEKFFDIWVFVHNSTQGLGPDVLKKLLELDEAHLNIDVISFGFEELRQELFKLNPIDIALIIGPAPNRNTVNGLGFSELQIVLESIAWQQPTGEPDLRPVPKNKLSANMLSPSVEILLKAGMKKANLVQMFFESWYDPTFGDKIAQAFKIKYNQLKSSNIPPNEIFMKLQEFALGTQRRSAEEEAAGLAVLAFLFERCDIFERPREEGAL